MLHCFFDISFKCSYKKSTDFYSLRGWYCSSPLFRRCVHFAVMPKDLRLDVIMETLVALYASSADAATTLLATHSKLDQISEKVNDMESAFHESISFVEKRMQSVEQKLDIIRTQDRSSDVLAKLSVVHDLINDNTTGGGNELSLLDSFKSSASIVLSQVATIESSIKDFAANQDSVEMKLDFIRAQDRSSDALAKLSIVHDLINDNTAVGGNELSLLESFKSSASTVLSQVATIESSIKDLAAFQGSVEMKLDGIRAQDRNNDVLEKLSSVHDLIVRLHQLQVASIESIAKDFDTHASQQAVRTFEEVEVAPRAQQASGASCISAVEPSSAPGGA